MSPSESYYTTTRKVSDFPKLLNEFPPTEPYEQFLTIHCPPMGTFFFRLDFRLNEEYRANSTSCEIVRQRYLRLGWKIVRKVTLSNLFIIPVLWLNLLSRVELMKFNLWGSKLIRKSTILGLKNGSIPGRSKLKISLKIF